MRRSSKCGARTAARPTSCAGRRQATRHCSSPVPTPSSNTSTTKPPANEESDVNRHCMALEALDVLGSGGEKLLGEARQRPGCGDLLTDLGNVGVIGIAASSAPTVIVAARHVDDDVCPGGVVVLGEHDFQGPAVLRGVGHRCHLLALPPL